MTTARRAKYSDLLIGVFIFCNKCGETVYGSVREYDRDNWMNSSKSVHLRSRRIEQRLRE